MEILMTHTNTRLTDAAPELLEALKQAELALFAAIDFTLERTKGYYTPKEKEQQDYLAKIQSIVKAAITKAT